MQRQRQHRGIRQQVADIGFKLNPCGCKISIFIHGAYTANAGSPQIRRDCYGCYSVCFHTKLSTNLEDNEQLNINLKTETDDFTESYTAECVCVGKVAHIRYMYLHVLSFFCSFFGLSLFIHTQKTLSLSFIIPVIAKNCNLMLI